MATGTLTARLRETLAIFDGVGEPLTTTEVIESLDVGRRSTYERLEKLVEHDRLETKKVGTNARVWWRPPTERGGQTPDWSAAAESLVDDVLDDVEVGIFVLDENFDVAWINEATEQYFGLERDAALGRDKRALVDEQIAPRIDDSDAFADTVLATYDDNTYTERFECHVMAGDEREARWLEHRSKPIESGAYAGGRVELYYDITDRKRSERTHDQDRRQFESIIDAVEEYAIFMLNPDGTVRTWNQGAERIKGYAAEEILGEHFSRFYTDEARAAGIPRKNLVAAAEQGSVEDEGWRLRADGSRFWANVTITAICGDDGEIDGYVKVTHDMTDRRERERQLRQEQETIERILETAPLGIGVISSEGEFVRTNERATELLAIDEENQGPEDYPPGKRRIYDSDGDPVPPKERPYAQVFKTGDAVFNWECQIEHPDGERRWLSVNAAPLAGDDGEVEHVVTAGEDITQLKEQAQRLERRRDDIESELAEMFERIDDGFVSLDRDLRFTYVNEQASALLGTSSSELVGEFIWDAFEPEPKTEAALEEALETQESVSFEEYYEPLESWFENHIHPSDDGLSVYFTDITERKRREQQLEESRQRYRTVVENFPNGMVALFDEELTYTLVGGTIFEQFGVHPAEIEGESVAVTVENDEVFEQIQAHYRSAFDGETVEFEFEWGDHVLRMQVIPVTDDDGEIFAGMVMSQDITERKQRERELAQYETLFEESKDVNVIVEPDGTFRYVTPSSSSVFGYDPEELVGEVGFEFIHPDDRERALTEFAKMIETPGYEPEIEFRFEHKDGSWIVLEALARDLRDDPDVEGVVIYTRDVTERRERERALEESERRYRTLVENFPNGAVILFDEDLRYLIAGGEAYEGLDVSVEDLEGDTIPERLPAELIDTFVPRYRAVFEGQASEFEFEYNDQIRQFRIVPVRDESGSVFAGLAISQDVTQHRERERELERQREQLTALNNLNDTVRNITEAVIDQSTREEIEATVCERLAESDSYEFAWVGDTDTSSNEIYARVEVEVENYLEEITLELDPDDPAKMGPAARALRTQEIQTISEADEEFEPPEWRAHAREYGYRSLAAIPIVHEDAVYGVLVVYSARPRAFEGEELAVLGQIGSVIGHAIAAIKRKQALTSDEITEIEFTVPDVAELAGLEIDVDGTISFDRAVSTGDGTYLEYGTVDLDAIDALEALVDGLDHFEEVTIVDQEADTARFELQLSEPPVVSVVASNGGYLQQAIIEDGDFHMTVHLPITVEARRIVDAVEDAYPRADLLRRRQITRSDNTLTRVHQTVAADLTDRQRATLEAAYHAGFFEWPRDATGEEVAESLGIAPSTFSQHLRKGQRQVFGSLFSTSMPA